MFSLSPKFNSQQDAWANVGGYNNAGGAAQQAAQAAAAAQAQAQANQQATRGY